MSGTTLLETLRGQGWGFTVDGNHVRIRRPRGALTEELRQTLTTEKAAILTILMAEQQGAPVPPQADDIAAVKVWSEVLQEAIWVVADGVPVDAYLGLAVYRAITHSTASSGIAWGAIP